MDLRTATDCGNSPRMALVAEVITAWASGDDALVQEWLAVDARWVLVGAQDPGDAASSADGDTAGSDSNGDTKNTSTNDSASDSPKGAIVPPPFDADHGEILTVLSHGRHAACDGYLVRGEERVDFCHVIRFAGATKTAKIREIRTYLLPAA
ncbi:MAG: hypothetical protein ACTIA5_12980 [Brachybacterium tyrofermentans]